MSATELEVFIREIPEDGVKEVELELSAELARAELFGDVEDFAPAEADTVEASIKVRRVGGSTLHVNGKVWATIAFVCGRCTERRELQVEGDLVHVLVPRERWEQLYGGDEEHELTPEDMDMQCWEGEVLNLRGMLREAILLELPTYAVCPDALQQLCDASYEANVAKALREKLVPMPEERPADGIDERWSKLKSLKVGKAQD